MLLLLTDIPWAEDVSRGMPQTGAPAFRQPAVPRPPLQDMPSPAVTPESRPNPFFRSTRLSDSQAGDLPVYKAPLGMYTPVSLVAGGSRASRGCAVHEKPEAEEVSPAITVAITALAPQDHAGLTVHAQPVLYWYLSAPTRCRIDVTLSAENAVKPLLDTSLTAPLPPGIQPIRLADHGIRLKPDVTYTWSVSLVPDPVHRSKDIIASGAIRHVLTQPGIQAADRRVDAATTASQYAQARLWYDAIDVLSELIATRPQTSLFRQQRRPARSDRSSRGCRIRAAVKTASRPHLLKREPA